MAQAVLVMGGAQAAMAAQRRREEEEKLARPASQVFDSALYDDPDNLLEKSKFLERLFLEEAMSRQLCRCFLFVVQFSLFLVMLWLAYPATRLLPVHQSLVTAFQLDSTFAEISTIEGLQNYLKDIAIVSKDFSPGSSVYSGDPLARTYAATVQSVPPQQRVDEVDLFSVMDQFTVMVWVQSTVRYDTILQKYQRQSGSKKRICWRFDLERLLLGEHEGSLVSVVNPLADSIYLDDDGNQNSAWKVSPLRSKMEADGAWHHFAVRVNRTEVTFIHDGEPEKPRQISRPLTDCDDGIMVIGSAKTKGKLLDLKYFPRVLSDTEVQSVKAGSKTLNDLLAGSGASALESDPVKLLMSGVLEAQEAPEEAQAVIQNSTKFNLRDLSSLILHEINQGGVNGSGIGRRLNDEHDHGSGRRSQASSSTDGCQDSNDCFHHFIEGALMNWQVTGSKGQGQGRRMEAFENRLPKGISSERATKWRTYWNNLREQHGTMSLMKRDLFPRSTFLRNISQQSRSLQKEEGKVPGKEKKLPDEKIWYRMEYAGLMLECIPWKSLDEGTFLTELISPMTGGQPAPNLEDPVDATSMNVAQALLTQVDISSCSASLVAQGFPANEFADVFSYVIANIRSAFVRTETIICFSGVIPDIANMCMKRCGMCKVAEAPSGDELLKQIQLQCRDRNSYRDWMHESCSWYQLNDQTNGACFTYADAFTKEKCQLTCDSCDTSRMILEMFDLDHNGLIGMEEANALSVRGGVISTSGLPLRNFPQWSQILCSLCCMDSYETFASCHASNVAAGGVDLNLILDPRVGMREYTLEIMRSLEASQKQFESMISSSTETSKTAVRFPEVVSISQPASLTVEEQDILPVYPTCEAATDCQGVVRGIEDPAANTGEFMPQATFCASKCVSGGCGDFGNILPDAAAPPGSGWCQICSICLESNGALAFDSSGCPDWCSPKDEKGKGDDGKDVDEERMRAGERPRRLQSEFGKEYIWTKETNAPGSFAMTMWIRGFDYQWILEKYINIPGLDKDLEGYNADTGELLCWRLGIQGIEYRSTWDQPELKKVENPMKGYLSDAGKSWHHLALTKESTNVLLQSRGGTVIQRLREEQLAFYVDGTLAVKPDTGVPNSWLDLDVKKYGFFDCSGTIELRSPQTVTANDFYEGPMYEGLMAQFLNEEANVYPTQFKTLPMGGEAITVLRFDNLDLPKGAYIKKVQLELCAAKSMLHYAGDKSGCGALRYEKSIDLSIRAQKGGPSDFSRNPFDTCQAAYIMGNYSTKAEVKWNVDMDGWDANAVYQVGSDIPQPPHSGSCQVLSPDLSDVVKEALEEGWERRQALTFFIRDSTKELGKCYVEPGAPFMSMEEIFGRIMQVPQTLCSVGEVLEDSIRESFPFWIIPSEDRTRRDSSPPNLRISYCMNAECISPTFLNAGPGQSHASPSATQNPRKLKEEVPSHSRTITKGQKSTNRVPSQSDIVTEEQNSRNQLNVVSNSETARSGESVDGLPVLLSKGEKAQAKSINFTSTARKLGAQDSSCPTTPFSSCLKVGSLTQPGLPTSGMISQLQVASRSAETSEIQKQYYRGLTTLPKISGPSAPVSDSEKSLTIEEFKSGTVAIIPPVMMQLRSPIADCKKYMPGLAAPTQMYFENQVKSKCETPYSCNFPHHESMSSFNCIDRAQYISDGTYFDRKTIQYPWDDKEESFFPDFLDLFTVPMVYRGGKPRGSSTWIDVQTSAVVVLIVFLAPSERVGTVLQLTFTYNGPSMITGTYSMLSYHQMNSETQAIWSMLAFGVLIMCLVDLILLFYGIFSRYSKRHKFLHNLSSDFRKAKAHTVSSVIPVVEGWDIFDLILRFWIMIFVIMHLTHYWSGDKSPMEGFFSPVEDIPLGHFEVFVKRILDVPWSDQDMLYEAKVGAFFTIVIDFVKLLDHDRLIRKVAFFTIMFQFFRIVVYLKVHPRVAILYKTIEVALDDLFHFFVMFTLLYVVLAFAAVFSFGDSMNEFANLPIAFDSQFRLLMGDMGIPSMTLLFGAYVLIFIFVVFFTLLNFFLAIIIDSYAKVIDIIGNSVVEQNVVVDVYCVCKFSMTRHARGWPSRQALIQKIIAIRDMDNDNMDDADGEDSFIPIGVKHFREHGVFPEGQEENALSLIRYYLDMIPALHPGDIDEPPTLVHQVEQHAATTLKSILNDYNDSMGEKEPAFEAAQPVVPNSSAMKVVPIEVASTPPDAVDTAQQKANVVTDIQQQIASYAEGITALTQALTQSQSPEAAAKQLLEVQRRIGKSLETSQSSGSKSTNVVV